MSEETKNDQLTLVQTSANAEPGARSIEVEYDFGKDLEDAVEKFGDEVVFQTFIAQAKVNLQAMIRRRLNKNETDEEILAAVSEWKPTFRAVTRKSPLEKMEEILAKMSPEERQAFKEKLLGA